MALRTGLRSLLRTAQLVVHANAKNIIGYPAADGSCAGSRIIAYAGAPKAAGDASECCVRRSQIYVKVFRFQAPMAIYCPLSPHSDRPTGLRYAVAKARNRTNPGGARRGSWYKSTEESRGRHVAIFRDATVGKTACSVEEPLARSIADAAAQRSQPLQFFCKGFKAGSGRASRGGGLKGCSEILGSSLALSLIHI